VSMAQRLVRRVCQYCKEPYDPPDAVLDFWGIEKSGDAEFTQAKGCYHCLNTGYKGRTGVFEVLIIDEEISEMILRNESAHAVTAAAERNGKLKTLKTNVAEKIKEGVTTFEEAATVVMV
jgi:type IV pilus assembly protein PilB